MSIVLELQELIQPKLQKYKEQREGDAWTQKYDPT